MEFHKQPIPPGQWSVQKPNKIHAVNYNSEGPHAKKSKTINVLTKTGLKPATGISERLVRSFLSPASPIETAKLVTPRGTAK